MQRICLFVIATALIFLTAGTGRWVASTTAHESGANVDNFRGGTPVGGGLLVITPTHQQRAPPL
jgi:hypothetical protein